MAVTVAWQEDEKRLTPDDVQAASFPLSRLGRRGLDEDHVRAFLRDVERELLTLLNQNISLRNEAERLRRRIITGTTHRTGGVLFGAEDAHAHAVRILSSAQLTADRHVADAQAYSHRLTAQARTRRDEILTHAQQHADMILEEATTRARQAATTTGPGRDGTGHTAPHAELACLRAFGEVYRTHLRAYTQAILASITEWETSETRTLQQTSAQPSGPYEPDR